ncbi:hypothetical protein BGX31_011262 [Mortierella sp. GBA43]|nr:hypothetical protein BGX31_011262 [Mortierella sp. GBA43]
MFNRSTGRIPSLGLMALATLSYISSVSANIKFDPVPLGPIAPSTKMVITWTELPPNGTATSSDPFEFVLRAESGQRYSLQKDVPQSLKTITVTLPKTTGGRHSFYAYYGPESLKPSHTNQFNITGDYITTTSDVPTATATPTSGKGSSTGADNGAPGVSTQPANTSQKDSGISGTALGGIIGGAAAVLLLVATIFFLRHRRLARERHDDARGLDDTKRGFSETTLTHAAPPPAGYGHPGEKGDKGDGMVPIPLSSMTPRSLPDDRYYQGGEHGSQQHQMQQYPNVGDRNPFDGPEETMASHMMAAPVPASPPRQHQGYQPPQLNQQPPRQPYGSSSPMMQQRGQGPYPQGRESIESEPESAYDPNHPRMMPPTNTNGQGNAPMQRNNSNPMMRAGSATSLPLRHSPSARSLRSEGRSMSPRMPNQQPLPQNTFQDRELMAAAAGHHAPGSPLQSQRQLTSNQHLANPSPLSRTNTFRSREIDMQPYDVQQHQYEQQQRALQRQQQKQQELAAAAALQSVPQQTPAPAQSQPAPASESLANPFNPTLYDDKAEIEEDGTPVYNGYRDTIFGAYSQPDDEEEEGEKSVPLPPTAVPAVPATAVAPVQQQEQQQTPNDKKETGTQGAPGVQRKKSVKFTGIPVSGPIDKSSTQQMYHSDAEDDDDLDHESIAAENDIKMRLMETEVPSPSSSTSRLPHINTTPSSSPLAQRQQQHGSPVRVAQQGYSASSSQFQQPGSAGAIAPQLHTPKSSPSLVNMSSSLGDGFYEDVLAAVDMNTKSTVTTATATATATATTPVAIPVEPKSATPPHSQEYLQHPYLQSPQPYHVEQETFGAPSPRITPAAASKQAGHISYGGYPTPPAPTVSPRSAARPAAGQHPLHQQQQDNDGELC